MLELQLQLEQQPQAPVLATIRHRMWEYMVREGALRGPGVGWGALTGGVLGVALPGIWEHMVSGGVVLRWGEAEEG